MVSPYQHKRYSYTDRGFYLEQLRRIWKYFPGEQVLVIKNEWLKEKPTTTLQKICNFLDITFFDSISIQNMHSRPYPSLMTPEEKNYLRELYDEEIRNLEQALGWDCTDWLAES
jgi:hypothetical protein